jgi:hypothetical protein
MRRFRQIPGARWLPSDCCAWWLCAAAGFWEPANSFAILAYTELAAFDRPDGVIAAGDIDPRSARSWPWACAATFS